MGRRLRAHLQGEVVPTGTGVGEVARRSSRQLRARAAELRRRQSNGLRNMGMAIVALVALLALGGQFASGAAGCFSSITEDPTAPIDIGGQPERDPSRPDEGTSGGVQIQVNTTPVPLETPPEASP